MAHSYRIFATVLLTAFGFVPQMVLGAPPFLTGVVEDEASQSLEVPRLPGNWIQTIAWMAPEGQEVDVGDLVVQLDKGELGSSEEIKEIELDASRAQAESQIAMIELSIINAESDVFRAEAILAITQVNAKIPLVALTQLTYDQYKLDLVNAQNALNRAKKQLANARKELQDQRNLDVIAIETAEAEWETLRNALQLTELRASKPGLVLYGEDPLTGGKIYAGQSVYPTVVVALVSNQENLQFLFWVHETDIRKIALGTQLRVTADAVAIETVDAKVTWISSQAESRDSWSKGGYFKMIASPSSTLSSDYLPGMSLFAEVKP